MTCKTALRQLRSDLLNTTYAFALTRVAPDYVANEDTARLHPTVVDASTRSAQRLSRCIRRSVSSAAALRSEEIDVPSSRTRSRRPADRHHDRSDNVVGVADAVCLDVGAATGAEKSVQVDAVGSFHPEPTDMTAGADMSCTF